MSENLHEIDHLEEIGTDLRIIKYILRTQPFTLMLQRTRNVRTHKIIKWQEAVTTHISLHPHFIFALHRKWMHIPLVTRCEIMLYLNEYKYNTNKSSYSYIRTRYADSTLQFCQQSLNKACFLNLWINMASTVFFINMKRHKMFCVQHIVSIFQVRFVCVCVCVCVCVVIPSYTCYL
jgi:hypothetical protein